MAKKYALLIANSEYQDKGIPDLKTPLKNLEMFRSVLEDPDIGGFDSSDITALKNQSMDKVRNAISVFFQGKSTSDFLLLYFTGHGFRGDDNLYLAVTDTKQETISASGIPDFFINCEIGKCRAKKQVVILDCCYSGFFSSAKEKHSISTVVVLTASDMAQPAWEIGEDITESVNSLYTHYLLQGLKTGEPDKDGDGWITATELNTYLQDKLGISNQKPLKLHPFSREETDIRIAKNPVAPLVNDARQRERNKAYAKAIRTWEKILELNSDHPEAHEAIKRLKERSGMIKDILQKLTLKLTEINDIYMEVARYLKQMQKQGIDDDGEIFLDVVKSYLSLQINLPLSTVICYYLMDSEGADLVKTTLVWS